MTKLGFVPGASNQVPGHEPDVLSFVISNRAADIDRSVLAGGAS